MRATIETNCDATIAVRTSPNEKKRWGQLALSFVITLFTSGIVFGWPALRTTLLEEGSSLSESDLGSIYVAGVSSNQAGRLFFGVARDKYGTRLPVLVSLICVCGGSIGVAVADTNNKAAFAFSMFLLGLGSGAFLCVLPVAALFVHRSGLVVSALTGGFMVSGIMFLLLTTASLPGTWRIRFGVHAAIISTIFILSVLFIPKKTFVLGADLELATDDTNPSVDCVGFSSSTGIPNKTFVPGAALELATDDTNPNVNCVGSSSSTGNTQRWRNLLLNKEYLVLSLWFSGCSIVLQYYVGRIGLLFDEIEREKRNNTKSLNMFAILYSASAVVAPLGGILVDHVGLGLAEGVSTIIFAAAVFIFAISPPTSSQHSTHCTGYFMYGAGRLLIYSMLFSHVGKRFGYSNYGLLVGLVLLVSAVLGVLNIPLLALAGRSYDTAQRVDTALSILLACLLPCCFWLWHIERQVEE